MLVNCLGSTCPLCGYNAGEDGEKILELHMNAQHRAGSRVFTYDEIARLNIENERLVSRTILVIGVTLLLVGLWIAVYGASNLSILSCSSVSCFTPQYVVDQVRADGFRSVYMVSQQEAYGGLLAAVLGLMGVSFWVLNDSEFTRG